MHSPVYNHKHLPKCPTLKALFLLEAEYYEALVFAKDTNPWDKAFTLVRVRYNYNGPMLSPKQKPRQKH